MEQQRSDAGGLPPVEQVCREVLQIGMTGQLPPAVEEDAAYEAARRAFTRCYDDCIRSSYGPPDRADHDAAVAEALTVALAVYLRESREQAA